MISVPRSELMDAARSRWADFQRLQKEGLVCKTGDFFPSVHYPPITMYPPITQEEMFRDYSIPDDGLFDIYAHLPFCHKRCLFCHYPIHFGDRHQEKEGYLDALEKEMDIYMSQLGVDKIKCRSILVGGGTPTHLTPAQLKRFLEFFCGRIDMTKCRQFNYDVDPATLIGPDGEERLRIMRDFGVDRLTIGVQSMNEDILKLMNRPHDVKEAIESIENSVKLDYMVNIEFIFGFPGQTLDNWIKNMEDAIALDVGEIQLYRLKVEAYGDSQAPIKNYKTIHPDDCPSVEEQVMMKQTAISMLNANGYNETLRRVFSKRRQDFSLYAHNQCCQLYDEVGFGLTAFSSLRNRFVLNTQNFDEYYKKIAEGELPLNRGYVRNHEEQMRWSIILPIKNRKVKKGRFKMQTGESLDHIFRKKIENLKACGVVTETEQDIEVTRLGAFVADEVAQQFHAPDYIPFPRNAYERGRLYPYDNTDPHDN